MEEDEVTSSPTNHRLGGTSTKLGVIRFPSHRGRWKPAFMASAPKGETLSHHGCLPLPSFSLEQASNAGTGSMLPASGTATVPLSAVEAVLMYQVRIHSHLPSPLSASGLCGAYCRPVVFWRIFFIYKFQVSTFIPLGKPRGILCLKKV